MRTSTDVLIVGGGPVGLMLAAELQRRGIDHLLVDERPRPDYYCKALGITPRTLEVWEQMGMLEDALRLGRFLAGVTASVNGEEAGVESVELGTMPYGFFVMAQYDTEAMLRQRYRISMGAPPQYWDEHADLHTPPTLAQLAQAAAPMLPPGTSVTDLRWASFYRISHRIVAHYGRDSAFLVGDAAHIHPPIGGQGMNTGIQDAHNLAWKLALAARGRAVADLLDSYDAERRPVGRAVVERTTHRMDDSLADGTMKFDQWMEDSQLLVGYRDSRWVAEDVAPGAMARGPLAGDRVPQVDALRRAWVARPVRLAELLRGTGHTLLLYFDTAATGADFQAAAALTDAVQSAHGDEIAVYGITHPHAQVADDERFPLLTDADGGCARAFDADRRCMFLVRPDGHIGYRADRFDPSALRSYLRRVFA